MSKDHITRAFVRDLASQNLCSGGCHPELLLQRYLAQPVTGDEGEPLERLNLFKAVMQAAKSSSLEILYRESYQRWSDSFGSEEIHASVKLGTPSRLILGLASENVLETGIRLHHIHGTPLIPRGIASKTPIVSIG